MGIRRGVYLLSSFVERTKHRLRRCTITLLFVFGGEILILS